MVIPFTGMIYDNEEGKKNSPQYLHRNRARWTGHNNTLSSDHMCNSPLHFEAWRTAAAESVAQWPVALAVLGLQLKNDIAYFYEWDSC